MLQIKIDGRKFSRAGKSLARVYSSVTLANSQHPAAEEVAEEAERGHDERGLPSRQRPDDRLHQIIAARRESAARRRSSPSRCKYSRVILSLLLRARVTRSGYVERA